jgi:hypothetical protein
VGGIMLKKFTTDELIWELNERIMLQQYIVDRKIDKNMCVEENTELDCKLTNAWIDLSHIRLLLEKIRA